MVTQTAKVILDAENRTAKGFNEFRRGIASMSSDLETLRRSAVAVLGFEYIVRPMARLGVSLVERTAELAELRQSTGLSAETLSLMRYAAEQSNTSLEALAQGGKTAARVLYEAAGGSRQAQDTLAALGIQATDGVGRMRSLEDVLFEVADRFQSLPDGIEKTALATQFFGRSGADLIPLLNEGSAGLRRFFEEAERLGLKLNDETVNAVDDMQKSLVALRAAAEGAGIAILQDLAPAATDIAEAMRIAAVESGALMAIWVGMGGIAANWFGAEGATKGLRGLQREEAEILDQISRMEHQGGTAWFEASTLDRLHEKLQRIQADIFALTPKPPVTSLLRMNEVGFNLDLKGAGPKPFDATSADLAQIKALSGVVAGYEEFKNAIEALTAADKEFFAQQQALTAQFEAEGEALRVSLLTPYEKYTATLEHLDELYQANAIDIEVLRRASQRAADDMADFNEKLDATGEAGREVFDELRRSVEGWSRDFADNLLDSSRDFRDFIDSIVHELARMAIAKSSEEFIFKPFEKVVENIFGSLLGGSAWTTTGTSFDPSDWILRAHGGDVHPGQPYVVGEQGPELFMPQNSGHIVPNNQLSSGVTIVQNINVDARNSDISEARLREASRRGAEEGYLKVSRDFTSGGPLRRMLR